MKKYLNLVAFSHSIFALPFALIAALGIARGLPAMSDLIWIIIAVVAARTAAMTFNRMVDAPIDARNPRTQNREIPQGKVSGREAVILCAGSGIVFLFSAFMLNWLAFVLSPLVLVVLFFYSYTKRFTAAAHLVLGFCLGMAPVGVGIALQGKFTWPPLVLCLAVLTWVAGFDIIYAMMDEEFDRQEKLHSMVVAIGRGPALLVSALLHLLTVAMLLIYGTMAGLNLIYFLGVSITTAMLVYEHYIITPKDISKINRAFFTINGLVSVGLFVFTLVDVKVFG